MIDLSSKCQDLAGRMFCDDSPFVLWGYTQNNCSSPAPAGDRTTPGKQGPLQPPSDLPGAFVGVRHSDNGLREPFTPGEGCELGATPGAGLCPLCPPRCENTRTRLRDWQKSRS